MRNAVSVESKRNAILFDAPADKLSAENITQQTKKTIHIRFKLLRDLKEELRKTITGYSILRNFGFIAAGTTKRVSNK